MDFSSLSLRVGLITALVFSLSGISHARSCNAHPPGHTYGLSPHSGMAYARMPMRHPLARPYAGPMRPYPPMYANPGYAAVQTPAPAVTAAAAPDATNAAKAPDVAESAQVSIAQMRFSLPTVTIQEGGTVTWQNAESMPHTVTASDGSFGSPQLRNGDVFSKTFDKAGTYSYYCSLHPMMRGTVVVEG